MKIEIDYSDIVLAEVALNSEFERLNAQAGNKELTKIANDYKEAKKRFFKAVHEAVMLSDEDFKELVKYRRDV